MTENLFINTAVFISFQDLKEIQTLLQNKKKCLVHDFTL